MPHVVLLGDSILDNANYVPGGPAVIDQVRAALPEGWTATLRAVDGAVVADVDAQARRAPTDATHLVLSVGGNDALRASGVVTMPVNDVAGALHHLAAIRGEFAAAYRKLICRLFARGLPLAVCTIYDAIPEFSPGTLVALAFFNDVITREAARAGADLIDLRVLCDHPADYSQISSIEPSAAGGRKIAAAIATTVVRSRGPGGPGRIYA